MQKYYIGIDLGGSKILAGLFDEELNLIGRNKMRTKPERGFTSVVERIARCAMDLVDDFDIKKEAIAGLGIGTPGSIGSNGNVIFAGNLGWKDVPLKKQLEKVMQIPVAVENDCNVAAWGIYHRELKAKPVNMVGIFLGTGVGAGLILNRQLYRGTNLIAGEIGHTVLDVNGELCNCGNRGCF
ncbi:MAG: ROK family protein, partial [Verrucomicrobia bacterium]|nr:ROK family protein [Verrucomicrobiota bacterium]